MKTVNVSSSGDEEEGTGGGGGEPGSKEAVQREQTCRTDEGLSEEHLQLPGPLRKRMKSSPDRRVPSTETQLLT